MTDEQNEQIKQTFMAVLEKMEILTKLCLEINPEDPEQALVEFEERNPEFTKTLGEKMSKLDITISVAL